MWLVQSCMMMDTCFQERFSTNFIHFFKGVEVSTLPMCLTLVVMQICTSARAFSETWVDPWVDSNCLLQCPWPTCSLAHWVQSHNALEPTVCRDQQLLVSFLWLECHFTLVVEILICVEGSLAFLGDFQLLSEFDQVDWLVLAAGYWVL